MEEQRRLEVIAEKIYVHLDAGATSLAEFNDELIHIPVDKFLSYNFINYPESYVNKSLLFAYKSYWEALSLGDWISIIENISNNELALYTCLSFLYKYLAVDSVKLYSLMPDVDEAVRAKVLQYFGERPGTLKLIEKNLERELLKYNLHKNSFNHIHNTLVLEGAPATLTSYPPFMEVSKPDDNLSYLQTHVATDPRSNPHPSVSPEDYHFRNKYVKLRYHSDLKAVEVEWLEATTFEQAKKSMEIMLEEIYKVRATSIILHSFDPIGSMREVRKYQNEVWMKELKFAGVHNLLVVVSNQFQKIIGNFMVLVNKVHDGMNVSFFTSAEDAYAWLNWKHEKKMLG